MLIDFYGLERFNKKQCIKCIVESWPQNQRYTFPVQNFEYSYPLDH